MEENSNVEIKHEKTNKLQLVIGIGIWVAIIYAGILKYNEWHEEHEAYTRMYNMAIDEVKDHLTYPDDAIFTDYDKDYIHPQEWDKI